MSSSPTRIVSITGKNATAAIFACGDALLVNISAASFKEIILPEALGFMRQETKYLAFNADFSKTDGLGRRAWLSGVTAPAEGETVEDVTTFLEQILRSVILIHDSSNVVNTKQRRGSLQPLDATANISASLSSISSALNGIQHATQVSETVVTKAVQREREEATAKHQQELDQAKHRQQLADTAAAAKRVQEAKHKEELAQARLRQEAADAEAKKEEEKAAEVKKQQEKEKAAEAEAKKQQEAAEAEAARKKKEAEDRLRAAADARKTKDTPTGDGEDTSKKTTNKRKTIATEEAAEEAADDGGGSSDTGAKASEKSKKAKMPAKKGVTKKGAAKKASTKAAAAEDSEDTDDDKPDKSESKSAAPSPSPVSKRPATVVVRPGKKAVKKKDFPPSQKCLKCGKGAMTLEERQREHMPDTTDYCFACMDKSSVSDVELQNEIEKKISDPTRARFLKHNCLTHGTKAMYFDMLHPYQVQEYGLQDGAIGTPQISTEPNWADEASVAKVFEQARNTMSSIACIGCWPQAFCCASLMEGQILIRGFKIWDYVDGAELSPEDDANYVCPKKHQHGATCNWTAERLAEYTNRRASSASTTSGNEPTFL